MNDSRQRPVIQNRILLLLLALTLIRGLIYASVTIPWWMGHDEDFHFAQVKVMIDQWLTSSIHQSQNWPQEMMATFAAFPNGRWSQGVESQVNITHIPDRYTDFVRPALSYYPYAWLGIFLTRQDLLSQLFALRIVSVLMMSGTVLIAFMSAKKIFSDSLIAQILVPWLIIFNPSFMITSSTISNANLAILLSTLIFYLLLSDIARERIGWQSLLAPGLTIMAFQAKRTTYFLLVVWGLLLLVYVWKFGKKYWLWIGITGGMFIGLLSFFSPTTLVVIAYYLRLGVSVKGLLYVFSPEYFWYTFSFFWIMLGWSVYPLAKIWYVILLFFMLLVVAGLFLYGWRHFKKNGLVLDIEQKMLLLSLLFGGISIAGLVGHGILRYEELEGRSARYIFPAIVPLSILMTCGWRALLPTTWREVGLIFLIITFLLFDTMVWLMYAIPWYYPFWPQ